MKVDIGIKEGSIKSIAEGLKKLMADTYALYLKTHNYHWNVTGPMFDTLHLLFEKQYNELWIAVDQVAERIRTIGVFAPGTYKEFSKYATIQEDDSIPKAEEMIKNLVLGHEAVIKTIREIWPTIEEANDQGGVDILTQRLSVHEKTAWMLRSLIA